LRNTTLAFIPLIEPERSGVGLARRTRTSSTTKSAYFAVSVA